MRHAWVLSVWLVGCGPDPEEMLPASEAGAEDAGPAAERPDDPADVVRVDATTTDRGSGADTSPDGAQDAVAARDAREVGSEDGARDAGLGMDGATPDTGCPTEMVRVGGACVDRWEGALIEVDMDGGARPWSPYHNPGGRRVVAVSQPGVVPQAYISGAQAEAACRNAGKRLCALGEWLAACRGPEGRVYPYGNTYVRRRCNEARTPHPVVQFYGTSVGVFTFDNMNNPGINMQPDTVARTGAFAGCVTTTGAWDMVGNLHEWIADSAGTFKGGFYVDAEINGRGCLYTTTAHAFTYRDYSTGFRCCADPR